MNFAGNFLLKVAESPGCVRGLIRLHLSYCTMRTMFWLKELNFYFNQFCRGVYGTNAYKIFTKKVMAEMKFLRKRYMEKRCHMIGSNHYLSYLGKGVGEAFTLFA